MDDDFKGGACEKSINIGTGWSFGDGDMVTLVGIDGDMYIVDIKKGNVMISEKFTYDELIECIYSCKGFNGITDNGWETFLPILNIDGVEFVEQKGLTMSQDKLIEWLLGERYICWKDGKSYIYGSNDMPDEFCTEQFEKEHQWEFSRNRMIEKTIGYLSEIK